MTSVETGREPTAQGGFRDALVLGESVQSASVGVTMDDGWMDAVDSVYVSPAAEDQARGGRRASTSTGGARSDIVSQTSKSTRARGVSSRFADRGWPHARMVAAWSFRAGES